MRISILVCGLALSAAAVAPAFAADDLNTLTAAEKQAGWKLLFDGKTTAGWRNYNKPEIGSGWKVVDGALSREEKGAGDIVTVDQYGAFELSIDFKISPEGNSGVMYHVRETEKAPWQTGPEIQIQDNKGGHDPQKCGWLYQFYKADTDATKPAGQWNTLDVLITPEKCVHTMNGVKYFEYVIGSKDWNEKLAASKFAKFPNFGKFETGYICLQDHGNPVAYRNIKIRPIADAKTTSKPAAKTASSVAAATSAPKANPTPKANAALAAPAAAKSPVATTVRTQVNAEDKPASSAKANPTPATATAPMTTVKPAAKAEAPAANTQTSTATAEDAAETAPAAATTQTYSTRPTIRSRFRRLINRITP